MLSGLTWAIISSSLLNIGCDSMLLAEARLNRYHESETNFFIKINGAQLTFIKDDKGEATAVIHHEAGLRDFEGKKLSVPTN
jgi:hypothetical protein